jgi:hypothetical protein
MQTWYKEDKMKKLFFILLTLGFLISSVGSVFGESAVNPASDYSLLKVYTCVKAVNPTYSKTSTASVSGGLGGQKYGFAIPTSAISPNSKIVGFSLITTSDSRGAGCSLYDLTTATSSDATAEADMANTNLITEVEVTSSVPFSQIWFPYPKKVTTQLGVMVGDTDAIVCIYYL